MDEGKMLIDIEYFATLVSAQARLNAIIDYLEYNSRFSEASVILAIAGEPFTALDKDKLREEYWKGLTEGEKKDEGTEAEANQN